MFNVGAGELLVILLVALIVLGPEKLPETARKIGNVMGEVRRMSAGFQEEVRSAMDTPNQAVQAMAAPPPATDADDEIRPIDPTGAAAPEATSDDPAA
jgi:Tat protein translocase TatB subunit